MSIHIHNIHPVPEGTSIIGAVVLMKGLNEEGNVVFYERLSDDLTAMEAIGMLTSFTDSIRTGLVRHAHPVREDE